MAPIAAGKFRWAVKDRAGNILAETPSVPYDILDNSAAPFTVLQDVYQGKPQGTINDFPVTPPANLVAHGDAGEYLDLEFYDTTSRSPDSSACTVDGNFIEVRKSGTGKIVASDRPVALADRATRGDANTIVHEYGLPDDSRTVAYAWSPVMRWIPPPGVNRGVRGKWRFVLDGT